MNATFAGHSETAHLLLERGARISRDLLMTLEMKVNILEEQAELGFVNPTAAEAWRKLLQYMLARKIQQDEMPKQ